MIEQPYFINSLSSNECVYAWKKIKHYLQPAIAASNGRWLPEYVLAALVSGRQTLWIVVNHEEQVVGAATSEIANYPEKRMVAIHFLGGDGFDQWYESLLNTMADYARANNCDGIECNARFGFWKWFKQDGFEKASCFYEKML